MHTHMLTIEPATWQCNFDGQAYDRVAVRSLPSTHQELEQAQVTHEQLCLVWRICHKEASIKQRGRSTIRWQVSLLLQVHKVVHAIIPCRYQGDSAICLVEEDWSNKDMSLY